MRTRTARIRYGAAGALMLFAAAGAACGGDDADAAKKNSTSSVTATTSVAATRTATEGTRVQETDGNAPGIPELRGDIQSTSSGLRYIDEQVGDGAEVRRGQRVSVHYTGWLTNGTKFDSSRDRGRPFTFGLGAGEVIRGWDEGVAGMKVGGKRRLILPADLGYGARGAPPTIPGNSTLIFDVELLSAQ